MPQQTACGMVCPMKIALAALALLLASPAFAQTITDGDTIKLNGTTWGLWGIDAPEARQACAGAWPAGREATATLRRLIEAGPVACELRGHDRYGRSIGLCRAGGKDLGAELVSAGMAWAFTRLQQRLREPGADGDRWAAGRAQPRLREGVGLASQEEGRLTLSAQVSDNVGVSGKSCTLARCIAGRDGHLTSEARRASTQFPRQEVWMRKLAVTTAF